MHTFTAEEILHAVACFSLDGVIVGCYPFGSGHINGTNMILVQRPDGECSRYVLQIINGDVFPSPEQVVENIRRITAFLREKRSDRREVLELIPARSGHYSYWDGAGHCFRVYRYIEDTLCLDSPETPEDFYQSGIAFGRFQRDLADFPVEKLHETLADFHNTPKRYRDLLAAVQEDRCALAVSVEKEIDFFRQRADFYPVLYQAHESGHLPLRVTHNDTKLNNVMLDKHTRKALCVIDLDTVMPGFSVNDFGDAVRFGANTAAEDEKDLSHVSLDMTLFEAYTRGFLEGCGGMLEPEEIRLLPEGAKMMTLECGMRFLTDYLQGDVYFKTAYPGHNLDRCRTQLQLVRCMEEHWDEMKACAEKYANT